MFVSIPQAPRRREADISFLREVGVRKLFVGSQGGGGGGGGGGGARLLEARHQRKQ